MSLLSAVMLVSIFGVASAQQSNEKVIYKGEMKSEKELHKDALEGKSDLDLKNINFEVLDDKGKPIDDAIVKKYFTAQKLKEIQNDENTTTSTYVIYAIQNPIKDADSNPGLNFTEEVWMWADVINVNGVPTWAKRTRYEAKWTAKDEAGLVINNGTFTAMATGTAKSTLKPISESSPSTYYPPTWGQVYVKTPTWDYVKVSQPLNYCGATITTNYSVRGSAGKIYSQVGLGVMPKPW